MPIYSYKAINMDGKTQRGEITASNERDLERKLKAVDLDLIDANLSRSTNLFGISKVKLQDIIILCMQLHQLENSGIPLIESLSDVRNTTENPAMRNILTDIYDDVINGKLFSEALRSHPDVFDDIFIGLVETGESTGNLGEVLYELVNHLKWVVLIRKKIKKALTYPTVMLFIMITIMFFMMLFVVPQLIDFLKSQNINLPIHTRALIATSEFFENHWAKFVLLTIGFILSFKLLIKFNYQIAYWKDGMLLKIPKIGNIIRKIEIARFCRFFTITFKSGISILDCLETSLQVVGNKVIKESIVEAKQRVMEGVPISQALETTGQFPKLVIRMFNVGEKSGNLDKSLSNVNYFYDAEVEEGVNNLIATIQPLMTVILGIIMAWIIASVFGPLYSNFSKLS